jgi:hypothetical protein
LLLPSIWSEGIAINTFDFTFIINWIEGICICDICVTLTMPTSSTSSTRKKSHKCQPRGAGEARIGQAIRLKTKSLPGARE